MLTAVSNAPPTPLHAAEGAILVDACEALVKGMLESQVPVGIVAAPTAPRLAALARLAQTDAVEKLLARHSAEIVVGGDGARAVGLALAAVRAGRSGLAVVPARDLVASIDALRDARAAFRDPEHGLAIVLEDDPAGEPMICPRRVAAGAGLPVVAPGDLSELRDSVEQALRLSRAGVVPVAIVVHRSLLASTETILARPNRVVSTVDELILQRKSRPGARASDTGDLMRVARRLEINALKSLPSPGEREVVGFITVGACDRALVHVLEELGLSGRVPVMRLGLVWPVDESTLQRFLDRVQQAVVLEPRPGSAGVAVLEATDLLRRQGVRVPSVFLRVVPPAPAAADAETPEEPIELGLDDATRPSVLVRKIIHLLHAVRPSLAVATRLEPSEPELEAIEVPARDAGLGVASAVEAVRQVIVELDQEMRSQADPESEDSPSSIVLDALPPRSDLQRAVLAEVFPGRRFAREGIEIVRQAARDGLRRIVVVVGVGGGGDDAQIARIADAAIPASESERARVLRADVNDRGAVRDTIARAATLPGLSVVVLLDGPPPRLDIDAIERTFVERDRLGYQPQLRLVWSADIACELRPPPMAGILEEAEERGATPIQGSFTVEDLGARVEGIQFRAAAMSEQVEVVRTKPPIAPFSRSTAGLAPPRALHGEQGTYRVHVAGLRGGAPGVVARILCDAGRAMDYRVECVASDDACGRGRRAWAQVLFVRMRAEESRAPRTSTIPYGEADLVIGVDAVETLRALGPDPVLRVASFARTSVVANSGPLEDQFDEVLARACDGLGRAVERCAQSVHSRVEDFATVCRTLLLSERLVDIVLLGVAFQRGLVPVSLEAIEGAVRRAEQNGFGRSFEAFILGRRLATGMVARRAVAEEREPIERLVRRLALELVRERFGGRRRAQRYALSAGGMALAFSRFGAGEDVDRAARAAVTALHRAIVWGGTRMMRRYEELLAGLLRADPSGELAVISAEPLADAVLVRDVMYVLAMSTSLEQRRRIRERLGVRASHGDALERRFLSRFELSVGTRRMRLDFRTSDWPAEVVRLLRPVVPWALRGDTRAQQVREYAISLAERAARGFAEEPALWSMCVRRFAMLASDGGLRSLTAAELRAGVEGL
ncbi:MAG: hypothetical protein LW636_09805 [Planctomycetaceae bacterium]|nr:hypothetical protein [Planctomycetaceae bacterium]